MWVESEPRRRRPKRIGLTFAPCSLTPEKLTMTIIDSDWDKWLSINVARGCSQESMVETMVNAGIRPEVATSAVARAAAGELPAAPPSDIAGIGHQGQPERYQYDPTPIAAGNTIHAVDRDIHVLSRYDRPQVIVFGNVLSPEECEGIIERSQGKLSRSMTVHPDSGEGYVIANRTSEGTAFLRGHDELIERVDRRVAALMNMPVENGEGLQVLRYGVGAEYRPHFDYFPPHHAGTVKHTGRGGQRVATLVMYLNDVRAGGETVFPDAGISVSPRRGNAVYFRYLNARRQLDPLSLHGGAPVKRGEKWIATRWMRERPHV